MVSQIYIVSLTSFIALPELKFNDLWDYLLSYSQVIYILTLSYFDAVTFIFYISKRKWFKLFLLTLYNITGVIYLI